MNPPPQKKKSHLPASAVLPMRKLRVVAYNLQFFIFKSVEVKLLQSIIQSKKVQYIDGCSVDVPI